MKSNNPSVSIIIPTYGGSQSLDRSIQSVLKQDYDNFDIIVVDDNNPDTVARKDTAAIMDKYSQEKRIIYIQHENNKNGAAARNTGVRKSKSKYICLLDDDDVFLPKRIEKQVEFLEKNQQFQACYCWRTQNNKKICGMFEGDLSEQLLDLTFTPTTSAIMLTKCSYDIIGGFDESYKRHQDYEFLLRYFKKFKMGVVPEVLLGFIGNEVDNRVYGKKLYDLKVTFFSQFETEINKLELNKEGYRKRVYAAHFSNACVQFIKRGNFILAIKAYFCYGRIGGTLFWNEFFRIVFNWIKKKV